jgi:hypothetical protein
MKTPRMSKQLKDVERKTLEIARDNIAAMEKVVSPTMAEEIKRVWVAQLAQHGLSANQALKLREIVPED